ncbi:MAG: cytochrome c oxidase assembly protein [Acidimicrobiales bacterium]
MTLAQQAQSADFWRWVPHPEVWLLVGGLVGLYVYAARVIGPKVVPAGTEPVTRSQKRWFALGILLLWVATDWPVHDIGEQYLYLVHMGQHTVLTLVMPPVLLMATPEWLARLVIGNGAVSRWVHRLARPVPAALAFNAVALLSHWQLIVNTSSQNGLFHYGMHTVIVVTAFLLWIPVFGPLPELRISMPAQMLYLFVTSIVPTVPGAWLTFAEGALYSAYDTPDRLWGLSVTTDQQVAGLFMKLGAGTYLWVIIAGIFFTWASRHGDAGQRGVVPSERDILTWDQVQREFDQHPAASEEPQPGG